MHTTQATDQTRHLLSIFDAVGEEGQRVIIRAVRETQTGADLGSGVELRSDRASG
jgi:hypothetical protein